MKGIKHLRGPLLILALVILIVFFGFYNQTLGSILLPPGIVVPVDDARAVQLLHKLVDKELEDDPEQRTLAAENLNLATSYIISLLRAMGRKGDINDTGRLNIFVNNWRNFALEGQYRGEDVWRGILDIGVNGVPGRDIPPLLCKYIRESTAFRSLQPSPVPKLASPSFNRRVNALQEYLVNARCDSIVDENYETFLNDFNAGGGWDTFERLLQPQNNIFGAIQLAFDELTKQRQIEEQSDTQEANSGSGYLGRRQCLAAGASGQCVIWSNVNIPAK